jgi:hypothetical protein
MNDGTNPKQQKASDVQSDHRAGWAVIEVSASPIPKGAGERNSMFSFIQCCLFRRDPETGETTFR